MLRLSTSAHVAKSLVSDKDKSGQLSSTNPPPSTIVRTIAQHAVANLRATAYTIPWATPTQPHPAAQELPTFVTAWAGTTRQLWLNQIHDNFMRIQSSDSIKAEDIYEQWDHAISSPGMTVVIKNHKSSDPAVPVSCRFPAVRLKPNVSRAQTKLLNQLFPYTSATDKRHMTMHLADYVYSLITAPELRLPKLLPNGQTQAVELVSYRKSGITSAVNRVLSAIPIGTNNVLAIQVLTTCLGSEYFMLAREALIDTPTLFGTSVEVLNRLKALSSLARRSQADSRGRPCPPRAASSLAYLELAFGRSANVTDWDAERANRCGPTIHIQPPRPVPIPRQPGPCHWQDDGHITDSKKMPQDDTWYALLTKHVRRIVRPLVTSRATKETYSAFTLRRAEWMASGSSGGATLDLNNIPSYKSRQGASNSGQPGRKVKIGKRAWAEQVPHSELLSAFRSTKPAEAAQASEKYENGKSRAIYGVEPIHYLINTYATKGFEEKLHTIPGLEKGATGLRQAQLEHHRAELTSDPLTHCTMLDFADFNRHHTPKAQALIFEQLADLGREVGACKDWIHANKWVARAKYNMTARFPNIDRPLPVHQGMFSGTKSTDFINTVLNLAYFEAANEFVQSFYQVLPSELYHVHQGDDVWLSNRNHLWPRLVYYTMHNMGFIFQRSKQMFGEGRGEYLRVLYQEGRADGYLHRALANFVLRPLQNDVTDDPVAWANSIHEGVSTLMRRGLCLSLAQVIWRNTIHYWVKAKANSHDQCGVRLPRLAVELSPELGGLGCPEPGTVVLSHTPIMIPTLQVSPGTLKGAPSHMTNDWITHVSQYNSRLEQSLTIRADALREMSLHNSYSSLPAHVTRAEDWAKYKQDIRAWARGTQDKLAAQCRRYECLSAKQLAEAVAHIYDCPLTDSPSPALSQSLQSVSLSAHQTPSEMMPLSNTLSKITASSRFKSVPAAATAYGCSRQKALETIFILAGESSSASQDARIDLQYILSQKIPEAIDLLLKPGSTVIKALNPFLDGTLLGYAAAQHCQVLAKYLALFGHPAAADRRTQAALPTIMCANTIALNQQLFELVRY